MNLIDGLNKSIQECSFEQLQEDLTDLPCIQLPQLSVLDQTPQTGLHGFTLGSDLVSGLVSGLPLLHRKAQSGVIIRRELSRVVFPFPLDFLFRRDTVFQVIQGRSQRVGWVLGEGHFGS